MLAIGGAALLHLAWGAAGGRIALLVVVVASYRQTCTRTRTAAGPMRSAGTNLGRRASLVAASALLVDYVLTVAVSVVAGMDNVVSAFPALASHEVALSVAAVVALRPTCAA